MVRRAGLPRQAGFTYLGLLFLVAVMSIGLAAGGIAWSMERRREKEAELLSIGEEIRHAIGSYYEHTPGSARRYPERLEDLLLDRRHLGTLRHLRRLRPDPITGQLDWHVLHAPEGGIMGVHSASAARPLKRTGTGDARSYADWKFVYRAADTLNQDTERTSTARSAGDIGP